MGGSFQVDRVLQFQSSRSLRTATPEGIVRHRIEVRISILAVLADRDQALDLSVLLREISILAVLADRDTEAKFTIWRRSRYFNPRGPCGPRPRGLPQRLDPGGISILAVLADRDGRQPHPVSGGRHISILAVLADRDSRPWYMVIIIGISILAVLADRDLPPPKRDRLPPHYFNPRGPCGPRPLEIQTP